MNTSLGLLPLNIVRTLIEKELLRIAELADAKGCQVVSMTFPEPCSFADDADEQINVVIDVDGVMKQAWELYWNPSEAEFTTLRCAETIRPIDLNDLKS